METIIKEMFELVKLACAYLGVSADDNWKREKCGNCEFRVTRERDPRLLNPQNLQDKRGWCRRAPIGLLILPPPEGVTSGYMLVDEESYACANFCQAKKRLPLTSGLMKGQPLFDINNLKKN